MSNRPTRSSRLAESTPDTPLGRRRLLQGSGAAAMLALAGCLDTLGSESDDESNGDESDDGESNGNGDTTPEQIDVVDAYLEAAADEEIETMSDLSHELNPYDPAAWVEEGWEFRGGDGEDVPEYDAEMRTTDGDVEDVYAVDGAEFWFHDVDLEDELEGESIAVVELTVSEETEERSLWVLVTEDGEWQILIQGSEDDTPDDPEEAFDEPIEDDADDVVVGIDWEYDPDDRFDSDDEAETATDDQDDEFDFEVTQAEVILTDSPGLEAHTVRIESAIDGYEGEIGGQDREPGSWAGMRLYPMYDPDGDQIEVIAISDDGETVVHREQYEP